MGCEIIRKSNRRNESWYEEHFVSLGICSFHEKYLLLKISLSNKYCPGCWDFVFSKAEHPGKACDDEMIASVFEHTGLEGYIADKFKTFRWIDKKSKVCWIIEPYLICVGGRAISLSDKYCDFRWVTLPEILSYDDKEERYLEFILSKTGFLSRFENRNYVLQEAI